MSESPVINPVDLGFENIPCRELSAEGDHLTLRQARDKVESEIILSAIQKQAGNIARAAETLGISRPTLYDLMKKHGFHHLSSN
jgi:two-component system NtrC family response regulator